MFNFEKLNVWQKAMELNDLIYGVTQSFPKDERFGLTNQIRRAAVSICSNIAEGTSRFSAADYARFIEIASGSLFEVVTQLTIARRQNFLPESAFQTLYGRSEEVSKMLSGLRRTLLKE